MITLQSTITKSSEQVYCDLDGEATLLNLKSGKYYGLTKVGGYIWNLLESPQQVQQLLDSVTNEYEVDSDRCLHDLQNLLQNLANEGLVEVSP